MNFVAVVIVSVIVLGHPFNIKSHLLTGLNRIFLCLNHSSQITKKVKNLNKVITFFDSHLL